MAMEMEMEMEMEMKEALPYIGMVSTQFAQVGLMIVGKKAMSTGITNFTFVFYSNALSSLILLPSFFFYRSTRPPLHFSLICAFFLLGVLGKLDWVIGGLYLVADCIAASAYLIVQASVLKNNPVELIVVFFYCFFSSILSALVSLFMDMDINAWMLQPGTRLFAVLYSGVFGSAFQVSVMFWCVCRRGTLFVAMFHPLGIVIAAALGIIFLGDIFYLGSLVGSIVIVVGFYAVMWGKTQEKKVDEDHLSRTINSKAPLLQIKDAETEV